MILVISLYTECIEQNREWRVCRVSDNGDDWNSCQQNARQAKLRRHLEERSVIAEHMDEEPLNCRGPKRKGRLSEVQQERRSRRSSRKQKHFESD